MNNKTFPLLQSQVGVISECLREPEATLYNLPLVFELDRGVDPIRLKNALLSIIATRPSLKTCFVTDAEGEIRQYSNPDIRIDIPIKEMLEEDFQRYYEEYFVQPFEMFSGEPLCRFEIIHTQKKLYWLMDIHHSIFDASSRNIFGLHDLPIAYEGGILPAENFNMYQAAEAEQQSFNTPIYAKAAEFYKEKFQEFEFTTLFASGLSESSRILRKSAFLQRAELDQKCQQNEISPNLLFMAAFSLVLSRLSRSDEVMFYTMYHGRTTEPAKQAYGMFVKPEPIATSLPSNRNVLEFIKHFRYELKQTANHSIYPFTHFCHDLKKEPTILYNFLGTVQEERVRLGDTVFTGNCPTLHSRLKDIACSIYSNDGQYEIRIEASEAKYKDYYLCKFAQMVKNCTLAMLEQQNEMLSEISLVSEEEKQELIKLGTGERIDYDKSKTWVDLFVEQAAKTPLNIAVVFQDKKYTYRDIDEISERIAIHLQQRFALKSETIVGVMIDRSEWMVIYPLAIMKAGGAYMPLDFNFPAERLQFMCEDADVELILSEGTRVKDAMPDFHGNVLTTEEALNLLETKAKLNNSYKAKPENMFVALYTSGTTGKPKGVILEQHNIVNFCHWYIKEFNMTANDRALAHANFGFDCHIMDICPALSIGASVYIIPEEMRLNVQAMNEYMEANAINIAFMGTQIGYIFATSTQNKSLRLLALGGEKLKPLSKPRFRFYSGCGPTECTIYAACYNIESDFDSNLIGRPLANYNLYIVDSNRQLVPHGMSGELVVAGDGIGRGYLKRPELNEQKFITYDGLKAYLSGDLVRWSEDGNVEYLGRIDNQLKLRGYRIELDEVESKTLAIANIKQAVAVVRQVNGTDHLVLYYVANPEAVINPDDLRAALLSSSLAKYMIPDICIRLDEMPLTPNGKIDRKTMPEPELPSGIENAPPKTPREKILWEIASRLLGGGNFGVTDDLFRLGMNSILSIRLAVMAKEAGVAVKANDLVKTRTIRGLLQHKKSIVDWAGRYDPAKPIVVVVSGVSGEKDLRSLIRCLNEKYSTLVVEPLEEHYNDLFKDNKIDRCIELYGEAIERKVKSNAISAFVGHCWGGRTAYRLCRRHNTKYGVRATLLMLDSPTSPYSLNFEKLPREFVDKLPDVLKYDLIYGSYTSKLDANDEPTQFDGSKILVVCKKEDTALSFIEDGYYPEEQLPLVEKCLRYEEDTRPAGWSKVKDVLRWRDYYPDIEIHEIYATHMGALDARYTSQYVEWLDAHIAKN